MLAMFASVGVIAVGVMLGMIGAWTLRALWRWLDDSFEAFKMWLGRL